MKKILISFSIIGVVSAIAIGGTIAYFSDVETSTGNTFTAGTLNLRVDSLGTTHNGNLVASSFWYPARDLTNEKFYTISDFKPGDTVKGAISLHVDDNPAWVCMFVENKQDDDNGLTEPEKEAGDTTGGMGEGELGKNIHVLAWRDDDADGQHDLNEPFLVDSFFDVFLAMPIRDFTTGTGPLIPEIPIEMIQMDLCGGTHIVNSHTGAVSCDGSGMGNEAQTDSLSADLSLYVEQHRNNPNFSCANVELDKSSPILY